MGNSKIKAMSFIYMICMVISLPPIYACDCCDKPHLPHGRPSCTQPPHYGGGGGGGGHHKGKSNPSHRPKVVPPIVMPPIVIPPPVIITPPTAPCPPSYGPPEMFGAPGSPGAPGTPETPGIGSGGVPGISPPPKTCPIDALKLGVCLDVLGGLVHIGLGDPVENVCCPILQGLLELEAAVCLCLAIKLKLLNLTIYIPLALSVLLTCGQTPPPGFICPPI